MDEVVIHMTFFLSSIGLSEEWLDGKKDDNCQQSESHYRVSRPTSHDPYVAFLKILEANWSNCSRSMDLTAIFIKNSSISGLQRK